MVSLLSNDALSTSLAIPDLTDKRNGEHALQCLIEEARVALATHWGCQQLKVRTSPVVPLENNYDRLGYPPDGVARDARYTRYVTPNLILRSHTTAAIPDLLDGLNVAAPDDLLLLLPGMVYRRDCIDRLHCAEPHQFDLWRLVHNEQAHKMLSVYDLQQMIATVMKTLLPTTPWRTVASPHPYTEHGVQIDALWCGEWIEVGESGLIARQLLQSVNLPNYSGLAMGLGLDRLLMIRKNIPDIRLLRSQDPRVAVQMKDLQPFKPVSNMPIIKRDLSVCVDSDADEETIGDQVRTLLPEIDCIESITVQSITPYEALPASAHKRMGMSPSQKNILLELVIRHLDRTLTDEEANAIRNSVYRIIHQGIVKEIALDG
ncbi:MAG: hypothetical protein MI976_08505 [Pseudomonadales bacterium]|nr:hypothetical protein [Pseudomonadales bacterium]